METDQLMAMALDQTVEQQVAAQAEAVHLMEQDQPDFGRWRWIRTVGIPALVLLTDPEAQAAVQLVAKLQAAVQLVAKSTGGGSNPGGETTGGGSSGGETTGGGSTGGETTGGGSTGGLCSGGDTGGSGTEPEVDLTGTTPTIKAFVDDDNIATTYGKVDGADNYTVYYSTTSPAYPSGNTVVRRTYATLSLVQRR